MQLIHIDPKKSTSEHQQGRATKRRMNVAFATATLLGSPSVGLTQATASDGQWNIDLGGLLYSESDSRVTAFEPIIHAEKVYAGEEVLDIKLVLDALTGATPSGAIAQDTVQTFTRPSGRGQYAVESGELPLDDTFRDTRAEMNLSWSQPLSEDLSGSVGGRLSKEYDFLSVGLNGGLSLDRNQKNTTYSVGFGYESDRINPEGGIPVPFGVMEAAGDTPARVGDDESKIVIDVLFGVTQVLNRRSVVQLTYSFSSADGYLTDPFKILSVVDENTGVLEGADSYRYERRPDSRTKNGVYAGYKYRFDRDMVNLSYRYMSDDWDIQSHTLEARYRWNISPRHYLEPHFRLYTQTAAEFYKPYLTTAEIGVNSPRAASADTRLANMTAYTFGAKYAHKIGVESEWYVRGELYQQAYSVDQPLLGSITEDDLYSDLTALIVQVGYSFKW